MEILKRSNSTAKWVALLALNFVGSVYAQSVDLSYQVPGHVFVTKVKVNDEAYTATINLERGYTYASTDFIKANGETVSISFEHQTEKLPIRRLHLQELPELTGSGIALVLGRDMFKGDKLKIDFINMKLTIGSDLSKRGKSYAFEPETGLIESPIKKFLPFLTAMIETDKDGCPKNTIDLLTAESVDKPNAGQALLSTYSGGPGIYIIRDAPRPIALLNAMDFCGVLEVDFLENRVWFEDSNLLRIRYILSFMTPLRFEITDGRLILGGSRIREQDDTIEKQNWRGGVVTKVGDVELDTQVLTSVSRFEKLYRSYVKERRFTIQIKGKEYQIQFDQ